MDMRSVKALVIPVLHNALRSLRQAESKRNPTAIESLYFPCASCAVKILHENKEFIDKVLNYERRIDRHT